MTMSHGEGSRVVYAGSDLTIGQGALGCILAAASDEFRHVQWLDGPKQGAVDIVDIYDLSVPSPEQSTRAVIAAQFEDSIDIPSDASFVVEAMDTYGVDGVLTALEDAGHVAVLAPYATEALGRLSASLRADAALSEALSGLEDRERESVLSRLAVSLLDDQEDGAT